MSTKFSVFSLHESEMKSVAYIQQEVICPEFIGELWTKMLGLSKKIIRPLEERYSLVHWNI